MGGSPDGAGRPRVPVWLLDVDGVLNAPDPGWPGPPGQGSACFEGYEFPMRWSPELITEINRLHDKASVEVRWATTWVDEIDEIEQLMQLPTLPTAFSARGLPPTVKLPDAKARAALTVVEIERRPLIWTDDDAIPARGPVIKRLRRSGQPVLLVTPDPFRGLVPEDLESIELFAADPWS